MSMARICLYLLLILTLIVDNFSNRNNLTTKFGNYNVFNIVFLKYIYSRECDVIFFYCDVVFEISKL